MKSFFLLKHFIILLVIFGVGMFLGIRIGLFFEWNKNEYYNREELWSTFVLEGNEYIPDKGFVPDEKTAIKIAKNVWEPIFGLKHLIWGRYSYQARLVDGKIWVIDAIENRGRLGGGPSIKIDKIRGTILEVGHTY